MSPANNNNSFLSFYLYRCYFCVCLVITAVNKRFRAVFNGHSEDGCPQLVPDFKISLPNETVL